MDNSGSSGDTVIKVDNKKLFYHSGIKKDNNNKPIFIYDSENVLDDINVNDMPAYLR